MENKISSTNVSFNYLSSSANFLNLVMNNISNCVLLLDHKMELQAFNDTMKTIFSSRKDEHLLYMRCGEAIGCAFSVDEMKECGKTSHCNQCGLRESALLSYAERKEVFKEKVSREFYLHDGQKEMKHLQFSTRSFYFEDEYYILMIIADITQLINQQTLISQQQDLINQLL